MTTAAAPKGGALANLRELVRIPTVSHLETTSTDWTQFDNFIAAVARLYPLVHSALKLEIVCGYTMLFHWAGRS
ncbi:MAG: acetylornithine deacetylase, partial [Rhodoglobus sp.]